MRPPMPFIYPTTAEGKKIIKVKTQELLENGMCVPAGEDIEQIVPAFVVKAGTPKARMVLDARVMNAQTYVEPTLPFNMDQFNNILATSNILNVFDIKSGFHHLRIKKGHERYFGFRTYMGVFMMVVLFFGYINAVQQFTRYVRHVIGPYNNMVAWMDDILAGNNGIENALRFIDGFLGRCIECYVTLNIKKCELFRLKTTYIGKELMVNNGNRLSGKLLDRIKKIKDMTSWKDVDHLINFAAFAISNIKNVSKYCKIIRLELKHKRGLEFNANFNGIIKDVVIQLINAIHEWIKPIKLE